MGLPPLLALLLAADPAPPASVAPTPAASPPPAPPAGAPAPARSPSPAAPADPLARYSAYERDTITAVLAGRNARLDPSPDGKTIEDVAVVTLEVFEPRDPAPRFLNLLHATSRRHVIEREVLRRPGDTWEQLAIDETARNLRDHFQLSLVLVLATAGSAPDRVGLLVVTKDVWSLRLNSDLRVVGHRLEFLLLQPSEENLGGLHHTVAALLYLQPLSVALGGQYLVFRLGGSRVAASASANVVLNRPTGRTEGAFGTVRVGQPLYSSRAEWAWSAAASGRQDVYRRYVDGLLGTFDARATPGDDAIPFEYHRSVVSAGASVTRSFGADLKNDLVAGFDATSERYRTFDLSAFDPVAGDEFVARAMPLSDSRIGPFIGYHGYTSRFLETLDVETLALQEDFRLGHEVQVRVQPVAQALGSTRTFLRSTVAVQYTAAVGRDGLVRASLAGAMDADADRVWDLELDGRLRLHSPRTAAGRILVDGLFVERPRNYLRRITLLGSEGRLRGFPSQFFYGKDEVALTVEYRSRAWHLRSIEVAGAAFVDNGNAFDGGSGLLGAFSRLSLHHAVGLGARVLFPQLQRYVVRLDVGVPIEPGGRPAGVGPFEAVLTFEQAFPVPGI